ncbi:MAG: hypothetical protein ACE5FY_01480 [Nitrospiria bacterium]
MTFFRRLFKKKTHPNPAVDLLYHQFQTLDPESEQVVSKLPDLAKAFREGGDYLLQKAILDSIQDYDDRFDSAVLAQVSGLKKTRMLRRLISLMLVSFFGEVEAFVKNSEKALFLAKALHFELYQALPLKECFMDYLAYQNPHFDNPKMAPAYKFGTDISAIAETPDLSFSFLISQQTMVIDDISKKLARWALFDEAIEPAPGL